MPGGIALGPLSSVASRVASVESAIFADLPHGLGGMILWSHGLHIAWAITSGRLAGQAVMRGGTGS